MLFIFGPCTIYLLRTTPIIGFQSGNVNNFIGDFLGKKYHKNLSNFLIFGCSRRHVFCMQLFQLRQQTCDGILSVSPSVFCKG